MKVCVPIDYTKTTENEVVVTDLKYHNGTNSKVVSKIEVEYMCQKFAHKAINIIKALASKKRFFYSYRISVLKPQCTADENIAVHVIKNRDGCTEIFDTLRRIGLVIGELKIGISSDFSKLYLSNKILRDLTKFTTDMQQEIIKYLASVAHLFTGLCTSQPEISCTYGNELTTDIDDWSKYILSFKDIKEISVEEIPTADLKCIRYYVNSFSTPSTITGIHPTNAFTITEDAGERHLIVSRDLEKDTFWICKAKTHTCSIYTNASLTYLDMEYDMFASGFAQALHATTDVLYVSDITKVFKNESHVVSVDLYPENYDSDALFTKITSYYKSDCGIGKSKLEILVPNYKVGGGLVDAEAMKESYKDDEYAQQLYSQVQEHYENFDLKTLNSSLRGFSNGDIFAMMFVGESGTGKSTAARVIPYRCGFPYISVNFCINIEESDLVGTMIPNPEKSCAEDPEFIWQDGILTKAVRYGYTAVLEEINFARPGVLGKLNSLLDENRQIDLPNGEILKAHPNFRMIATCNIAYEGTNRFNKALINRFEIIHEFKELEKTEVFKVIKSRISGVDDVKLNKVYTMYEMLKKFTVEKNLDVVVSIRQLLNIFKQGKYYNSAYDAIVDILVNGAFIELPEYKELFINGALNNLKKEYLFKL